MCDAIRQTGMSEVIFCRWRPRGSDDNPIDCFIVSGGNREMTQKEFFLPLKITAPAHAC
jgi:hypothetical protein